MAATEQGVSELSKVRVYTSVTALFPRLIPLLLAAITFDLYSSVLGYGFLDWDDVTNIVGNYHLMRFNAEDFRWMFTASIVSDYKPMVWLSYAADRLIWGFNPVGFHLTNILLHSANAVLVYWTALFLLRQRGPDGLTEKLRVVAAALVSILFAVHPQRVESVMWISERKDVLYSFFYLASLVLYIRWTSRDNGRGVGLYLGSAFLGILSMLSKSMAVSLPIIMLLLDAFVLRRIDAWRPFNLRRAVILVTEKLPLFIVALLIGLRAIMDHESAPMNDVGPAKTLWMFPFGLVFYLKKAVWPVILSPLYPAQENVVWCSSFFEVSALLILVATAGFLLACIRGHRWPLFLWLFFIVSILPVLPFRHVADRYTYLPSLGLSGLAVGAWLVGVMRGSKIHGWRVGIVALPLGVLFGLIVLNWNYAAIWRDSYSLWSTAVVRTPSAKAYYLLAAAQLEDGQLGSALRAVNKALEYDPLMDMSWNQKGAILARQNRADEAIECLRQAISLRDASWEAHLNLGIVLGTKGQLDDAVACWLKTIELNPDSVQAHVYLGLAYEKMGRPKDALRHLRIAHAMQPSTVGLKESIQALEENLRTHIGGSQNSVYP